MSDEQPPSLAETDPEQFKAAGKLLVSVANGLAHEYGVPDAMNLLWAAAIQLTTHAMSKEAAAGWLRASAAAVEADQPPPRAKPVLRIVN